jgi:hypothetical protein
MDDQLAAIGIESASRNGLSAQHCQGVQFILPRARVAADIYSNIPTIPIYDPFIVYNTRCPKNRLLKNREPVCYPTPSSIGLYQRTDPPR